MIAAVVELAVLLLLLLINGLLAGSEIAVVSSRKARLHHRAREGDASAQKALDLANSPNRFLSTVQIGITAVAIVAGAFGGARVAATVAPGLVTLGVPDRFADQVSILLVLAAVTFLTLVIGELVPKRIALHDPERFAARIAGPMQALSLLAAPLVRLLGFATDLVLRLFPSPSQAEPEITEDEIRGMIAHATATGVLEATEQQIVERLFHLSDTTIGSLMTPRDSIGWLDRAAGPEAWRRQLGDVRHSRYFVADGDLDRHVGYVRVQDLLRQTFDGETLALDPLLEEAHVLPSWTPVFRLLELFQWSGAHIALVAGPTGRIEGVVTLNDVLEGIVGDLPEQLDLVVPGIMERDDGSWLVDGLLPFEEFLRIFAPRAPREPHIPTVHAFMVDHLGGEPRLAAHIDWRELRLEIVDMDGSRVDKLLVMRAVPSLLPAREVSLRKDDP